ncbi:MULTISPECIES: HPr kinase/phosphorylase [unclassified Roseibium]|uniref:HPr kinase/phosphorylase n=1 Tax=unclassified Roseibium TaxID=2629323 RepID=UPI0009278FF8|nr:MULTISPECIES: HPr kinase/phosphatase C-terminal domain-containing protein [unclassified Roseibium]OJJ12761.1 aldolase [Alphaproteobacteria bacterium AO1-B]
MTANNIHANCLVVGTKGLLIRGKSGSGKSLLSDTILEAARSRGHFAALVADDRVLLNGETGRLLAEPPKVLEGLMEVRGGGIVRTGFLRHAQVHLIVDLCPSEALERLPDEPCKKETVLGVVCPLLRCPEDDTFSSVRLIRWAFRHLYLNSPDYF